MFAQMCMRFYHVSLRFVHTPLTHTITTYDSNSQNFQVAICLKQAATTLLRHTALVTPDGEDALLGK